VEVDVVDLVLQIVLAEDDARTAEGIALDQIRAGLDIVAMDLLDRIGPDGG
jgi:hypothetical protein